MGKRCIFYFGHRSRYGQSFLEPLLQSQYLDVQEIVIGDLQRWNIFSTALSGDKVSNARQKAMASENYAYLKTFKDRVQKLKPGVTIREVHDANAPAEIDHLKEEKFDLGISVAFPQIFKKSFISAFDTPPINFHPSYLPRCRGAHPVYWTIAGQEKDGGTSCHFLTENLDQGPLIAQIKIPITEKTYYKDLYDAIVSHSAPLIKEVE
jgi:methionyl-tRNA formyltransferase